MVLKKLPVWLCVTPRYGSEPVSVGVDDDGTLEAHKPVMMVSAAAMASGGVWTHGGCLGNPDCGDWREPCRAMMV